MVQVRSIAGSDVDAQLEFRLLFIDPAESKRVPNGNAVS